MLRIVVCLAITVGAGHTVCAQNYTLKGSVKNAEDRGVPVATISVLKAADSSWVQSDYTDDSGNFKIADLPANSYILNVAALNYKTQLQQVVLTENKTVSVTLQKEINLLKEVTVSSKKPFIETGLGKTIVNVDASILSAGTNVLELLKKSPGVTVDGQNNISLQGNKGVLILIDGRETYLSGDGLADYLKTLSSDEVAQLELITQPSAKYDAAGVAGIINIKTKKEKSNGFNGSATATYGQGVYPHDNQNILLNYKKKKLNLMANINHYDGVGWQWTSDARTLKDAATQTSLDVIQENSYSKEIFANYQLKLGADYTLNDKITLGGALTGTYHPNHENTNSYTVINDPAGNTTINSIAFTPQHFVRQNFLANAYLKYDIDKQTNMTVDVNCMAYYKTLQQFLDNKDYDVQNQQIDDLYLQGNMPASINIYNIKDDLSTVLANDVKLETGFKSSLAKINDKADYSLFQNNVWVPDPTRSNHFLYSENINALYTNARKSMGKKWEVQAGVRAEQTNIDGTQLAGNVHISQSRLALFPTAFVSYKLNDKHQFEVNFGRRIERPNYQSLNPFIDFADKYEYRTGNPELQPQYSYYAELKHNYKNELITTVKVRHTTDGITGVIKTDTATLATISTEENTSSSASVGLLISYNKLLFKWWQLSASGELFYGWYNDSNASRPISVGGTASYMSFNSQFTLGKGWTAEGQYIFAGTSIESATAVSLPSQWMDFGVAKKVLHDTATIKLTVSDPFNVNGYGERFATDSVNALNHYKWHTRECGITFTYNFGKKYEARIHSTDAEDTKRINM